MKQNAVPAVSEAAELKANPFLKKGKKDPSIMFIWPHVARNVMVRVFFFLATTLLQLKTDRSAQYLYRLAKVHLLLQRHKDRTPSLGSPPR